MPAPSHCSVAKPSILRMFLTLLVTVLVCSLYAARHSVRKVLRCIWFGSKIHGPSFFQLFQLAFVEENGDKWRARRKFLTLAFHTRILQDSIRYLNKHARILVEKLLKANGAHVEAHPLVNLCSLNVILEAIMGLSLDDVPKDEAEQYLKAVKRTSEIFFKRSLYLWLYLDIFFHASPLGFEFRKVVKILHDFTDKVIDQRWRKRVKSEGSFSNSNRKHKTLLDLLIDHEESHPGSLSRYDIREEVDTFVFAGHDTTAAAVTFALFLLGNHPEVQERAALELSVIFGESDRDAGAEDLSKMVYLERVIKEALRLYPSVPYFSRNLKEDLKLKGGLLIPAGSNVGFLTFYNHRDPRFFPEPEKFDPERFNDEECKKRRPYTYLPFSAGLRNCIGQKFAMMEMKVVLSTVLRSGRVQSLQKPEELNLMTPIVLRTDKPIIIKLTPKQTNTG